MRKFAFLALALTVLLVGGCDTFRKIAGRPTSDDIEKKRAELAAAQARLDSLEFAAREAADSVALEDSLKGANVALKSASDLGELCPGTLDHRYYIVVGAFKNSSNCEKMLRTVIDAGYLPCRIDFQNGFSAVGICPENTLRDAELSLRGVQREDFCPDDVWILVNK